MLSSTRFFRSEGAIEKKKTGAEKIVIDVGGEPFHALAVAFIDSFKNGAVLPETVLKNVLGEFFACYPDYRVNQVYVTPLERMRLLINSSRKSELVDCFAFVLWRITKKDELLVNPVASKSAFQGLDEDMLQADLKPSAAMLPAAARALKLQLSLSFKEPQHELRAREIYNEEASFNVELQVQGGRYYPTVKNKDDFAFVGQLAITVAKPNFPQENETIAEQLTLIAKDNQIVWQDYQHYLSVFNGMRMDGDLDKGKLVKLYIQFLPKSSDKKLFDYLETVYSEIKIVGALGNREEEEMRLLVEALSRGLSTGQINADNFFESLEHAPKQSTAANF